MCVFKILGLVYRGQTANSRASSISDDVRHMSDEARFSRRLELLEKSLKHTAGKRWIDVDLNHAVEIFYVQYNSGICSFTHFQVLMYRKTKNLHISLLLSSTNRYPLVLTLD